MKVRVLAVVLGFGPMLALSVACPKGDYAPPQATEGTTDGESSTSESPTSGVGCGDGVQDPGEQCDDGAENSNEYAESKHCDASCSGFAEHCGDGSCQPDYEDALSCALDCPSECGNGSVEPGEFCDPGAETLETPDCDQDCTDPVCGDNYINAAAGEACDDANNDETDECLGDCVLATCGDGFVQAGVEVCDDGNDVEIDDCSSECTPVVRRKVFLSSLSFTGSLGGLDGADARCQTRADVAGLGGQFKAWLSTAGASPSTRFDTAFNGVYELIDGTPVASGWAALTDPPLLHAIDQTETGDLAVANVWTSTNPSGGYSPPNNCNSWSNSSASLLGSLGDSSVTDIEWTQTGGSQLCSSQGHLYCFEDG